MYFSLVTLIKIGLSLTIILSCDSTSAENEEEESLNLNMGFDLTQGTNGAPSLRIRKFEGLNINGHSKRSVKDDSSSESEEKGRKKDEAAKKLDLRDIRESESDEGHSSGFVAKYCFPALFLKEKGSDGDRGISTKGIPYNFDGEKNPKIHERFSKNSESE